GRELPRAVAVRVGRPGDGAAGGTDAARAPAARRAGDASRPAGDRLRRLGQRAAGAGGGGAAGVAADALAAAFVVPHPEDYRALHPTLVRDLYGELIHEYATFHPARDFPVVVDDSRVSSLADLRAE